MKSTFEELKTVIQEYLGDDSMEITEETNFADDLGLSSLDMVTVVGDAEETFGIEIEERAATGMKTVGDLLGYIAERL